MMKQTANAIGLPGDGDKKRPDKHLLESDFDKDMRTVAKVIQNGARALYPATERHFQAVGEIVRNLPKPTVSDKK